MDGVETLTAFVRERTKMTLAELLQCETEVGASAALAVTERVAHHMTDRMPPNDDCGVAV